MSIARLRSITILLILVVLAGCSDHHFSNTAGPSSQTDVSNVQIKTLKQNVQYQVTANVTNPSNVIGGTGQLESTTGQSRRHQAPEVLGSVPITAQNLNGNVLTLVFNLAKPPTGPLLFSIIDASGHQTNGTPINVPAGGGTSNNNPGPPPPLAPGTIVIKTVSSGAGIPGGQTLSGLNIFGAASYGPLTIPLNSQQTISNAPAGNYTAAAGAHAYFAACPAQGFTVPSGGTVTLTYIAFKQSSTLACTVTVASPQFGNIVLNLVLSGAGVPLASTVSNLTLSGPQTIGPFTFGTLGLTFTNVLAGSYTASQANGYIVFCPSTPFTVPAGGTATLTYTESKPPALPTCTVVVS